MKLSQLAAKPQLIKIVLDDESTLKEFGEALDFYVHDRQPVEVFIKLASLGGDQFNEIVTVVNELILDETGTKIITDGNVLPQKLYIRVVEKVIKQLGE
jgi:hypothetical protein